MINSFLGSTCIDYNMIIIITNILLLLFTYI